MVESRELYHTIGVIPQTQLPRSTCVTQQS